MKLVNKEQIVGNINGEDYNLDRYDFEIKTALTTKELTMMVDFDKNTIHGDMIAYGEWGDTNQEQNIQMVNYLKENNLELRPITSEMLEYTEGQTQRERKDFQNKERSGSLISYDKPNLEEIDSLDKIIKELSEIATQMTSKDFSLLMDVYDKKDNPYVGGIYFTLSTDTKEIVCCDNTTNDAWVESFPVEHWVFAKDWLEKNSSYEDYQLMLTYKIKFERYEQDFDHNDWVYYTITSLSGELISEGITAITEGYQQSQISEPELYKPLSEEQIKKELVNKLPLLINKPDVTDFSRLMQYLVTKIMENDHRMVFITKENLIDLSEELNLSFEEISKFNEEIDKHSFLDSVIEGKLPSSIHELEQVAHPEDDILICYGDFVKVFELRNLQYIDSIKEVDLDNDGVPDRIDIDDSRNSVQTVSDLSEVGNKTQKPSQLEKLQEYKLIGSYESQEDPEIDR